MRNYLKSSLTLKVINDIHQVGFFHNLVKKIIIKAVKIMV